MRVTVSGLFSRAANSVYTIQKLYTRSAVVRIALAAVATAAAIAAPPASAQTANTPSSITAQFSGKCIDVDGADSADNTLIIQYTCAATSNQLWTPRPYLDGYQLVAGHSGKCIAVQGNSKSDGAKAVQMTCAQQDGQTWYFRKIDDAFTIVSRLSGKCLVPSNGSPDNNAAIVQMTCDQSAKQRWVIAAKGGGAWSALINFPMVPVAAANLPNGKILVWAAEDRLSFSTDQGKTYTAIYDPANSSVTERLVTETGHDMFCPGVSLLFDGSVFVTGGLSSSKTSLYHPASNTWTAGPTMKIPRGYQASTILSTGGVFTVGGSWSGGQGNKNGETWTSSGGWRLLPNVADDPLDGPDPAGIYRGDNHMWLFAWSNGRVFQAGPSAAMNWIDTNGNGSVTSAGTRGSDPYSMNGNAVMYDIGRILKTGGAPAYSDSNATKRSFVIDIRSGVQVREIQSMTYARGMHNSVVLPNGQVLIVGGLSYPVPFSDDRSVLVPELWDPSSEQFAQMKPMQVPRNYHSVALLMLDGRVFTAGGGLCGTSCGGLNHTNAQIFTPPYLLNADGSAAPRPKINSAPATASLGKSIAVSTDTTIDDFVLIRMGTSTHSINTDQRRIPLSATASGSNTYTLAIPSDAGVVVPGYYMLFAIDTHGVPSVAKSVQITPNTGGSTTPPPTATLPGKLCAPQGGTCTFSDSQVVSYGVADRFIDQLKKKTTPCTVAAFGGDPAVGVLKSCYVSKKCTSEGKTCDFSGTKVVHYGANNKFVAKVLTKTVQCGNAVFGDPIPGVKKACYVAD